MDGRVRASKPYLNFYLRGKTMKAIKNGKIILEDEILDGKALLLSDRIILL